LRLVPGCAVVQSPWPVASIITAHLQGSPSFQEVGRRLRSGVGECAMVWRQGLRLRIAACSPSEAAFVQAVLAGASLAAALERASGLEFNLWLPAAVQSALVIGVVPLAASDMT
jgi:hypothetical protein